MHLMYYLEGGKRVYTLKVSEAGQKIAVKFHSTLVGWLYIISTHIVATNDVTGDQPVPCPPLLVPSMGASAPRLTPRNGLFCRSAPC